MYRRALLLLCSSAIAFALVACGDDDDGDATPTERTSPTEVGPSPSPTPTEEMTPTATATPTPTEMSEPNGSPTPTPPPGTGNGSGNGSGHGTGHSWPGSTVVACNDILAPVDKQHRLPAECAPQGLVELPGHATSRSGQFMIGEAAHAFVTLSEVAAEEGHEILGRSAYRSYDTQVAVYNNHVQNLGREQADRVSARPGHSEHQLGTTVDVTTPQVNYELTTTFGNTAAGRWLEEHAWEFGFIISYPAGQESVTGYSYEPWHIRYVGPAVAEDVKNSGLTLGEYLLQR